MKGADMQKVLKSWGKVFASTVLALFLADGGDVVGVGWGDLRTYLAAGVASVFRWRSRILIRRIHGGAKPAKKHFCRNSMFALDKGSANMRYCKHARNY